MILYNYSPQTKESFGCVVEHQLFGSLVSCRLVERPVDTSQSQSIKKVEE